MKTLKYFPSHTLLIYRRRVKFARNLAFFDESDRKVFELLSLLNDRHGRWTQHRAYAKIDFFLALFGKHDSSWKNNSKLQIELFLLILFNFDFMTYYVAQSVGLPNKLSSTSLLSKMRVFLVIQISMFPFLLTKFLLLSLIYRINCKFFKIGNYDLST